MALLLNILTEAVSMLGGIGTATYKSIIGIMKSGFNSALQFHQEGIAIARDLGLSASQAQAYTNALTESTAELANKYGVTANAIREIQRGISEATGRQLLLNEAQREQFVITDKLVGAQARSSFTSEIMNHLGGQVSTVEGAISKAYATASKQGLNAKKFSETVAKNLSLANKLSFRDGVNGIIKMTALSEKLGFNLQSIESAAKNFMDLETSIENSAKLQMLGGAAGAYGSNPLTMSYEANYDPEAFTERMTKMLGGYARFDEKTGMANINGMNRDFVKNIADAMGISMDEAMTIAKKNSEIKFKENQFSGELNSRFGNDEAIKNYILNNSTYNTETKRLELNGEDINKISDEKIAEIKRLNSMDDHELMVQQAQVLTSLPEQIQGAADSIAASFASGIERYIPDFRENVKQIGDFLKGHAKNWGKSVGDALGAIAAFAKDSLPTVLKVTDKIFNFLDAVIGLIGPITKWVVEHPWASLFMWLGGKALFGGGGGKALSASRGSGAGSVGSARTARSSWRIKPRLGMAKTKLRKAARGIGNSVRGAVSSWRLKPRMRMARMKLSKAARGIGNSVRGAVSSWRLKPRMRMARMKLSNAVRGVGRGGIGSAARGVGSGIGSAMGVGIAGVVGNIATDYAVEKGKISRGGVAHYGLKMASTAAEFAAMGSMLGPIGTGIGAAVGAVKGAYDTWKSLPENADKNFLDYAKSVGGSVLDFGKKAFNKIGSEIKNRGGFLKVALSAITAPIRLFGKYLQMIGKFLSAPVDTVKGIFNSLKNWWNSDNKIGSITSKVADFWYGSKKGNVERHANGGIVGGNSYSGDRVLAGLNSGEMVLNTKQQASLFNWINNIPNALSTSLKNTNDVKAKPVGGKEYIYIPSRNDSVNGVTEISVRDINLNVNGTLKLDAGSSSKNLDINRLLNDTTFISQLKNLIKESINNDINNGRFMNDIASMRGMPSPVSLWGK